MWPAVPSVSCGTASAAIENGADERGARVDLGVTHRARIEDHPPVPDAGDHRRLTLPKPGQDAIGATLARLDDADGPGELDGGKRPAPRASAGALDHRALPDPAHEALGASEELGVARAEHRERRDIRRAAVAMKE